MQYAFSPGGIIVPKESPLRPLWPRFDGFELEEIWRRFMRWKLRPMLAGFVPAEGELLVADLVFGRDQTDRDASLLLALFTNTSPGDSITQATLTRPSGTGYAAIALTDGSWGAGNPTTYAEQTFTAGSGGWTGSVQGYDVESQAAGGTPRIVAIEVDSAGPYTFAEDDTYAVTLSVTVADPSD